ncbi:MAG: S41 family peptidase [Acidobacteriaceae bacterium]
MSRSFQRAIFGISIAVILVVFLGAFGPAGVSASQSDGAWIQMNVYEEVLHKIQTDYVTTPNIEDVTNGALHGLLESLDSESSYLTKDEYATYVSHQHEGQAQVGLEVSKRYGYGSVVTVIPASPAAKANIQDGDLIEAIGAKTTHTMSLAMIRLLLEGKPGTTVSFDLVRPGNPKPDTITLTRAMMPPPALAAQQYKDSSILYLKPTVLTGDRVDEILARLRAMPKEGDKKVILDLRDTAVGSEEQGIRLANAFLKSGTIAMLTGQTVPAQTFSADPSQCLTSAPVVVLVNGGTAGAAEIVAGAILDNHRGDVVGERTFGEGGQMKTFPLPDGAALLLTVAKYETPDGKKIEDAAVTPNVEVAGTQEEFLPGTKPTAQQQHADDQLNKALEILKQKSA